MSVFLSQPARQDEPGHAAALSLAQALADQCSGEETQAFMTMAGAAFLTRRDGVLLAVIVVPQGPDGPLMQAP